MHLDVLGDMKKAVEKAIKEGQTFASFKKNIKPALQQKGWWGKKKMTDPLTDEEMDAQLGSDRRLRIILNTNRRQAYQKGQYQRTMQSSLHPYLMYRVGNSPHRRKKHLAGDGLILPKDDPFWANHLPQKEYNCRCYTRTVTEARKKRYEKDGISIPPTADGRNGGILRVKTQAPKEEYHTKGTLERIPKGVHPAFNWHHGKSGPDMQGLKTLLEKAEKKCSEQLERLSESYLTNKKNFDTFIENTYSGKLKGDYTTPGGFIDKDIHRRLLKNKALMRDSQISLHLKRCLLHRVTQKQTGRYAGNAVGENGVAVLIEALLYGKVYFDKK